MPAPISAKAGACSYCEKRRTGEVSATKLKEKEERARKGRGERTMSSLMFAPSSIFFDRAKAVHRPAIPPPTMATRRGGLGEAILRAGKVWMEGLDGANEGVEPGRD